MYLGSFATAEEAALCVARSPEEQAAAGRGTGKAPARRTRTAKLMHVPPFAHHLYRNTPTPPQPLRSHLAPPSPYKVALAPYKVALAPSSGQIHPLDPSSTRALTLTPAYPCPLPYFYPPLTQP